MNKLGGNLGQRGKNKSAFMELGVWNLELRQINLFLIVENNIDIEAAGSPFLFADTAGLGFYIQASLEELFWLEFALQGQGHIFEIGLIF